MGFYREGFTAGQYGKCRALPKAFFFSALKKLTELKFYLPAKRSVHSLCVFTFSENCHFGKKA